MKPRRFVAAAARAACLLGRPQQLERWTNWTGERDPALSFGGWHFGFLPLDPTDSTGPGRRRGLLVSLSARGFRTYAHDAARAMRRMIRRERERSRSRSTARRASVRRRERSALLGRDFGPGSRGPSVRRLEAIAVRPNMYVKASVSASSRMREERTTEGRRIEVDSSGRNQHRRSASVPQRRLPGAHVLR